MDHTQDHEPERDLQAGHRGQDALSRRELRSEESRRGGESAKDGPLRREGNKALRSGAMNRFQRTECGRLSQV